jgi:transcriptional regulator with XRE-family HTH domain
VRTTFLERLRSLRKSRHLKQEEIAPLLGLSYRSYRRYETGESEPTLTALVEMADFFGVTLDDLVGREPPCGG